MTSTVNEMQDLIKLGNKRATGDVTRHVKEENTDHTEETQGPAAPGRQSSLLDHRAHSQGCELRLYPQNGP